MAQRKTKDFRFFCDFFILGKSGGKSPFLTCECDLLFSVLPTFSTSFLDRLSPTLLHSKSGSACARLLLLMARRDRICADLCRMAIRALEGWSFFLDAIGAAIQLFLQVADVIVTRRARHDRNICIF